MPRSLTGVLASIPGIGGFEAAREQNQALDLGQLQQVGALQGILSRARSQQQEEALKGVLAQSGGDPAKAVQALVQAGTPQSLDLAAKLHSLLPKPTEGFTLAPGAKRFGTDNKLIAESPDTAATERVAAQIEIARQRSEDQRLSRQEQNQSRMDMIRLTASLRQAPAQQPPVVQTDEAGNVSFFDRSGNLIRRVDKAGKPTADYSKTQTARKQSAQDINRAITELEEATKEGGLIDKSTGSGAGALVDIAAGFVGKATPGSIAVGQLKPIYDLALKMVPRFEGPQSDKDTKSYEAAAGQLANPNLPNAQKKAAGKEMVRLMKYRRAQFSTRDVEALGSPTPSEPAVIDFNNLPPGRR